MKIIPAKLKDVFLIEPTLFVDQRGYFYVPFNKSKFEELSGKSVVFIQDNESRSSYGTLRGLHYQKPPYAQAKLVRVSQGEVLDIVVDLRHESPTFGQTESFILNDKNKHQLFVPRGFAHGFVVLSNFAVFNYKVDNIYDYNEEGGIAYDDKTLRIDWRIPSDHILLSEKDKVLQTFEQYKTKPDF